MTVDLLSVLLSPFKRHKVPLTKRDFAEVVALNKLQLDAGEESTIVTEYIPLEEDTDITKSHQHNLLTLPGVGPKIADLLYKAGYTTAERVRSASDIELMRIKGIGRTVLNRIRKQSYNKDF